MSFSIVDSFIAGKCIFPERPENALLSAVELEMTDQQWSTFQDIWLCNRFPLEPMIRFLVDNKIAFTCPVCGGTKVRQIWELVNDRHETLVDMPCYCHKESL